MALEQMWAGWRAGYVTGDGGDADRGPGCPLCAVMAAAAHDAEAAAQIVALNDHVVVMLNAYPYNSGHLLAYIYDVNGGKGASFSGIDREPVTFDQISPNMRKAVVAIEDNRYWSEGALDPNITRFGEFPDFASRALDPAKHKKIAMFCTGGIRCEKASSYLLSQGFEEVYHLKGGILKYLEDIPQDQSLWRGECFVFDQRVALGHGLSQRQQAAESALESETSESPDE